MQNDVMPLSIKQGHFMDTRHQERLRNPFRYKKFQQTVLQVVFKIHCYLVVEVDALLAPHVVLCLRVREEVNLDIVIDAFLYEAQAVLPYYNRVDNALAYEKLALEVLSLVDEAYLCVTFSVDLRVVRTLPHTISSQ